MQNAFWNITTLEQKVADNSKKGSINYTTITDLYNFKMSQIKSEKSCYILGTVLFK